MNPTIEQFIHAKQDQLHQFEARLEQTAKSAIGLNLGSLRAQRDELVARLDELKKHGGERVDVLRMGIESAWAELEAAFETALAKDPNAQKVAKNAETPEKAGTKGANGGKAMTPQAQKH